MTDFIEQIASLSPEKRALFERMLKEKGIDMKRSLIVPQPRDRRAFALSFAQQRLWFLDQLEPDSPLYNIPLQVRLTGKLDIGVLNQCLNEIVHRHEALRTTFEVVDQKPVQVIAPEMTVRLEQVDLRGLLPEAREREAVRIGREEARQPFNLVKGPLLRMVLLQLEDQDHMALVTMHHIISDGWSVGIFFQEIALLYEAFSLGRPSPLSKLPVQYVDFTYWQQEWLQGELLDRQLNYWKQQLGGDLPVLSLPADRPRPAVQTSNGASLTFCLPIQLGKALNELGKQENATLFMVLLAAFQVLLYRYCGQEDICVGTPVANRTRSELENLIGFFINTLVMRTDLSGQPTFREILKRVRETAMGAYDNQDIPFEMLVEELQPARDMSHNPLFQVMFVLQNTPAKNLELPGLRMIQVDTHSGTSTFDITLIMAEEADGLKAVVEYNTDLFDAGTILRLMDHFQVLLEGIIANPDQSIDVLPLLNQAERDQILLEWNKTEADFPQDKCLHALFEAQVRRSPNAVALVLPDLEGSGEAGKFSYLELNRRANTLAHYLRRIGVEREVLVGLCLKRSLDMVVGMLGILKAGGAYLPLDPNYPKERLAFMLQDSGTTIVLTQEEILPDLPTGDQTRPELEINTVCLDSDWETIAKFGLEDEEDLASDSISDDLAYVIYTSGSTGLPKGVMVPHRCVVNHNFAVIQAFQIQPGDRILQFATINFDTAVEEIFPALLCGATVVLRPDAQLSPGRELNNLLEAEKVTIFDPPTAYWHEWVNELAQSRQPLPESLRLVVVGGEKTLPERFKTWLEVTQNSVSWINSYGPTEATVIATLFSAPRDLPGWDADKPVPIGKPLPNTQIYILDQHMQPVPVGVPGELYIGGVGVVRGYLNQPELTADKFILNPFVSSSPTSHSPSTGERGNGRLGPKSARLYRTGDLARYLPDGNIEFIGRTDYQVKIRGFRIEPGEIVAVLNQHPGVKETAVVAREDDRGSKRLVAYVVPDLNEKALDPDLTHNLEKDLRRFLKTRLPEYMLPSMFMFLEALPLLPNGKLDLPGLPELESRRLDSDNDYVAPHTPVEEIVAGIWSNVLGVERVGITDNFFEIGGHSLVAAQVISRLQSAFNIELPLRRLFEAPTIAELVKIIETQQRQKEGFELKPILPTSRDLEIPLSFAQQRLWFLDQYEPGSPLYNIPGSIRLKGSLNLNILERCINEILRRHEILRTTFRMVEGKPVQIIAAELKVDVPVLDLSHLPELEREVEIQRLAIMEAQQPFDLESGPLLRVRLFNVSAEDHLVLLTMHHIISDGWSTRILFDELTRLYEAFLSEQPSPLAELSIQYADFSHWQRGWLQGEVLETQLGYWKQQLAGSPFVLELPTDLPRPAVQGFRGAIYSHTFPLLLTRAFKELCHREGATLFMAWLAAIQVLLYRYTGQEDFNIGTPIANRNREDIEGLIGFFVNTLVIRSNLSGEPSFKELLKRVREAALGAYAHQDLPFEMIVDALQPERFTSHSPLFQVMFVYENSAQQEGKLPGLNLESIEAHSGTAKFDLTFILSEEGEQLVGVIEYRTELFAGATIQRMAQHFQTLVESLIAHPDMPVSRLTVLPEEERRLVLDGRNDTAANFPYPLCAHQLFEAQVDRAPEAIAVVYPHADGVETLSYQELDRRSNQLAHYLSRLGVGPEVFVGICIEKTAQMIVCILGVLKAGGAYIPLDPSSPSERLVFMLRDSQVRFVLTQNGIIENLGFRDENLSQTQFVCLDQDWPEISHESEERLASDITPENLAYVIYTSGSTGKPKGTLLEHRGVVNLIHAYIHDFNFEPESRVLQFFSFGFDGSVLDIFSALLSGAALYLPSRETLLSAEDLHRFLRENRITHFLMTPSILAALPEGQFPDLQVAMAGGESCSREVASRWLPGRRFVNAYGPTEATVAASWYEVKQIPAFGASLSIGKPITNMQMYVLDKDLQPVPVGVPGELHIGGIGLARGYLNRPDLSAEKFVPNPFSRNPGARIYRTGDLVRYLPDGNIEFLGRIDYQVKIRGFRVELGEIESALSQHPAIAEVVVWPWEETGHKRLAAYLVIEEGMDAPNGLELKEYLRKGLPDYMVPSAFVILPALPLMVNGKIDRARLPVPELAGEAGEAGYIAPRSRDENILAGIWEQTLNLEKVGINDNFFELGGDSILAIQVIARAKQAGLHLLPRNLFEQPTIAGLAAATLQESVIKAEQGLVEGAVPLTPIQQWFFEQDFREKHHWNQALMLEIHQALEPHLLERTVGKLLSHHDALRLRFRQVETSWEQENAGIDGSVPFEWIDLSRLPVSEQRFAIESRAAEIQATLNLTDGPVMRIAFFDLGPDQPARMLFVVHHLAMDGISWRILLEDFQSVYEKLSLGQEPLLPPKTTAFKEWALRLSEYARSPDVLDELSFWLSLGSHRIACLPVDYPDGENTSASEKLVTYSMTPQETDVLLHEVPSAYHTNINDVLLTALVKTIANWTGSSTCLIELEGHGREDLFSDLDLSRTIGWFTAVFPVALRIKGTGRPGEDLKSIKEQLRRVPRHGIGFGLSRYSNGNEPAGKSLQILSPPQIGFNYLGQFDQALQESSIFHPASELRGPDRSLSGHRHLLIEINGAISGGQLRLEWAYSQNLYRHSTIDRLVQKYGEILHDLIKHCQSPEAGGYTPSDFNLANLDQRKLDKVLTKIKSPKDKGQR